MANKIEPSLTELAFAPAEGSAPGWPGGCLTWNRSCRARWCPKSGAVANKGAAVLKASCTAPTCTCLWAEVAATPRLLYVPLSLADEVERRVELTDTAETALADISAVNLELLRRRELT